MNLLSIDRIEQSINGHIPERLSVGEDTRQAAVAVILRDSGEHTEVLFILRATKQGDPWSGHMAFPGGHREDQDNSLRETAARETMEEIGLDLSHAAFLGELDAVRANPNRLKFDIVVTPFFCVLHQQDISFSPNHEVADVLWGSLNEMYSGSSFTTCRFEVQGEKQTFPGYDVAGQIVWGLTYRILDSFFTMMDPNWVSHDQQFQGRSSGTPAL